MDKNVVGKKIRAPVIPSHNEPRMDMSSIESQKGDITLQQCSVENKKGDITLQQCSVENKKGVITLQQCSVENKKGDIAVHRLYCDSALLVLNGTSYKERR